MRIFLEDTPILALKISKKGVGMYLGPPCYGYAINCHLVCLAIPGTCLLCMKKQKLFVTAKSEIHICSNKHETCLVKRLFLKTFVFFPFAKTSGYHLKVFVSN